METEKTVTETLAVATSAPAPVMKMSEEDRLTLQLAKSRLETLLAQANQAASKAESSELAYRYAILQTYMKYGLTASDSIDIETGAINVGGASQVQQAQVK